MDNEYVKTDNCDSCNNLVPLTPVMHHQEGNPHIWWYCERCKWVHDREIEVNKRLKGLPEEFANDPSTAVAMHSTVDSEMRDNFVKKVIADTKAADDSAPVEDAQPIDTTQG